MAFRIRPMLNANYRTLSRYNFRNSTARIQLDNRNLMMLTMRSTLATNSNRNDDDNSKFRRAAGVGGMLTVLMGKTKWFFAAAKLTKFTSVFSMLATTGTYALFFGWPFAVGMVGQVMLHESGHALAMRALNIPFGPAVFVPFMGAVIPMQGRPKDVREEALVAIAGPAFGGITAAVLAGAGVATGSQMLITLADFGFMINLFNMMPIGDLDGGRISKAISKYLLLAGFGGGVYAVLNGYINNPIFYLVLLSGAFTTYGRFFGSATEPHFSYYRIPRGEKVFWSGAYFGLIAALFLAMQMNRYYMKSIRELRKESGNYSSNQYSQQMEQLANDLAVDDPYLTPGAKGYDEEFFKEYFGEDARR